MKKTILITGSTDGIGLATAKMLAAQGHTILLHGRNPAKLAGVEKKLRALSNVNQIETYIADLSNLDEVEKLASQVIDKHAKLDVLINNAGIYKTTNPITDYGIDIRFVVNTIAPYLLTQRLLTLMDDEGRVINLSSAAQAPVDLKALKGRVTLSDMEAYSQSKLGIVMWTRELAKTQNHGPAIIAVNPGSLLASKMVTKGLGVAGKDISIGADILCQLAISGEFDNASGKYFDNDSGQFSEPHSEALSQKKSSEVVRVIEEILADLTT